MSTRGSCARPKLDRQRHRLLFELIRQRSIAYYVSQQKRALPEDDPVDLQRLVQCAVRSIDPERPRQPLL